MADVQPPLPEFEGLMPVGVLTKVNGSTQRVIRPLHLRERGVLVLEYEVTNVGHKWTDDGAKRAHTLSVLDAFDAAGERGQELLAEFRAAYREDEDARAGRAALPGMDEPGAGSNGEAKKRRRGSIAEQLDFIATLSDPADVFALMEAEEGGKNRKAVIEACSARVAELGFGTET